MLEMRCDWCSFPPDIALPRDNVMPKALSRGLLLNVDQPSPHAREKNGMCLAYDPRGSMSRGGI